MWSSPRATADFRAPALDTSSASPIAVTRVPVLCFLVFAALFALLRSHDIGAVDGASRCLEVYRHQALLIHQDHHLLYLADVYAWTRLAGALGFHLQGPFDFYSVVELMNGLAAAGCLAIFCGLLHRITSSWPWAVAGTLGFGFSRAFLVTATNSNEPMVGLFWSFLGLMFALMAVGKASRAMFVLSGFIFALAMATYQSMVLLAPAVLVVLWREWPAAGSMRTSSARLQSVGAFAAGGAAGLVIIFGAAFRLSGIPFGLEMFTRFFSSEDSRAYLGLTPSRLLNLPVGAMRNIFPILPRFTGIRQMLAAQTSSAVLLVILLIGFASLLGLCAVHLRRKWATLTVIRQTALLAAAAGLVCTLVPVVIWSPHYDKLWLEPLACLAVILVLGLSTMSQDSQVSPLLSRFAPALLLLGVLANLTWAVPSHTREFADLKEPQRLAGMIGPNDLFVGGWDSVSGFYGALWADPARFISFPQEAVLHGPGAVAELEAAVARTRKSGGRVFFLSILELPEPAWSQFLGVRCGVPYDSLRPYRANSRLAATFAGSDGSFALMEYDAPSTQ